MTAQYPKLSVKSQKTGKKWHLSSKILYRLHKSVFKHSDPDYIVNKSEPRVEPWGTPPNTFA